MKKLQIIKKANGFHWVGDGFPVRNIFSYSDVAEKTSPFLLLDYAGPRDFEPTTARRGVGEHPHRGFETVTIVYSGEVEHRDSSGGGGRIGPGDLQWMTAGSGIVHEEFHSSQFAKKGGRFELVQLWVNLPSAKKWTPPRYQAIEDRDVPTFPFEGGIHRVIAGEYGGHQSRVKTESPLLVLDSKLRPEQDLHLKLPPGWNAAVLALHNTMLELLDLSGAILSPLMEAELAIYGREGEGIHLKAKEGTAHILVLAGLPLDEPIVGYGPFVMNTEAEIRQAIDDYRHGRLGQIKN
jgi:redox-sensitive bicupin YhaK (pirin superfamily)